MHSSIGVITKREVLQSFRELCEMEGIDERAGAVPFKVNGGEEAVWWSDKCDKGREGQ